MDFKEYLPLARATIKELPLRDHLVHMTMGAVGEVAGELVDAMKKAFIYGKVRDKINEMEEFGDACWYIINLLPELEVSPAALARAVGKGVQAGEQQRLKWVDASTDGGLSSIALCVTQLSVSLGAVMLELIQSVDEKQFEAGSAKAVSAVEVIGQLIGFIAGVLEIDVPMSLDRNIAKLKARYGDKFSQQAALERNLDAERAVLEGRSAA